MEEVKPTNLQFGLALIGLVLMLIFLNWVTFSFVSEIISFFVSVNQGTEVEPTSAVAIPMLTGCLVINLLFAIAIVKIITKERYSTFLEKWAKRMVMLCFFSIGLNFTNPLVHHGLNAYAKEHGYSICPNDRSWKWLMFRTQYVLDPSKCKKN